MTPEEKWRRLQNPTCAADYGLGLTEEELRTFPEGRRFLAWVRSLQRRQANLQRAYRNLVQPLAVAIRDQIDQIALAVLARCPDEGPN